MFKRIIKNIMSTYRLRQVGFGSVNYIDVGSIGGLPEPWGRNSDKINFLLKFEPNDEAKESRHSLTCNIALWETDGEKEFYIYKGLGGTGSSLYKQNYAYVQGNWGELKLKGSRELADTWFERSKLEKTTSLVCRSLDSVLNELFPEKQFHFIKIDAQGAEQSILKGANELLSTSCVGLQLELFVLPLYEGIALMDEVVAYLEALDFELVKKFPAHGSFDSQHECVFLHKNRNPDIVEAIKMVYGLV